MRSVACLIVALVTTASSVHAQTTQPVVPAGAGSINLANSIKLEREGCFGACAIYSIEISTDGNATFEGRGFVDVHGTHRYRIAGDDVAKLFATAEADDLWSMKDRYESQATDLPTYILSVTADNRTKTIIDYMGQDAWHASNRHRTRDSYRYDRSY